MSKNRAAFLLGFSLIFADMACALRPRPAPPKTPVGIPTETRIPDGSTVLPVKWAGHMPLVAVFLNGQGPYHFGLDTGLTGLVLSPKMANGMNIVRWSVFGDTVGRTTKCPVVNVRSLKMGNAEFTDLEAAVRSLEGLVDRKYGVDLLGIIGIRTFAKCRLILDLSRDRVLLDSESVGQDSPGRTLPLQEHETGLPTMLLEIGGIKQAFVIDTGSDATMTLPESVAAKLDLGPVTDTKTLRYFGGLGKTQTRVLHGSLWLGTNEVASPTVSVGVGIKDSLIGIPILKQFKVTIDQRGKTVSFETRLAAPQHRSPPSDQGTDSLLLRASVPQSLFLYISTPLAWKLCTTAHGNTSMTKPSNSGQNRSKRRRFPVKKRSKRRAFRHAHLNILGADPLWR